ncbi:MAG TPA: hypothetical protein PKO06_14235, partial [Candidatus Ozemobacteraceae bacterium]|nr:hypothetical protein [Candidatus Ozemobacteraceae bacterium]
MFLSQNLQNLSVQAAVWGPEQRWLDARNLSNQIIGFANFFENPLIGVGWGDTGGSESSYLGGAAAFGIGYAALMACLLFGSMLMCLKLTVFKRRLPKADRALADMFIAWNAAYFAGAAFEGYLIGRSSTPQVMALLFAGIGVHLKDMVAVRAGTEAP